MSYQVYSHTYQPAPGQEPYVADESLANAVNIAVLLGQPLLITGEPGTGKTRLAYSVADQLGLGKPLRFNTKSSSTSQELFYRYDALRHYRSSQTGANEKAASFLRAEPLGAAILRTLPSDRGSRDALLAGQEGSGRSVVLIDEIDKAPRDFPNDILSEIEMLQFRVPELDGVEFGFGGDPQHRPIVILTSNSEKHLPDAFLRRCVFAHIEFPDEATLERIVVQHQPGLAASPLVREALGLFSHIRLAGSRRLAKLPATAELIQWVKTLAATLNGHPMKSQPEQVAGSLHVLLKSATDLKLGKEIVAQWAE